MSAKPNNLATFVKGKIIDSINSVVATLNWVVSCWDKFKLGNGLKFEAGSLEAGQPKLELNLIEGDNVEITDENGAKRISVPGGGGGSVTVVGTDGTSAEVTGTLTFVSASDSNVKVSVSGSNGNATVTIGVYYK